MLSRGFMAFRPFVRHAPCGVSLPLFLLLRLDAHTVQLQENIQQHEQSGTETEASCVTCCRQRRCAAPSWDRRSAACSQICLASGEMNKSLP